MNGRVARKLRKQAGDSTPRKYSKDEKGTCHAEKTRKKYQVLKKEYMNK